MISWRTPGRGATDKITRAVRQVEERMPTYVTTKEVKLVWGAPQLDAWVRDGSCAGIAELADFRARS